MPKLRKLSADEIKQAEQEHQALEAEQSSDLIESSAATLEERYPYLAAWVDNGGMVELGTTYYTASFIRVLDTGGTVWEGRAHYHSLDAALTHANQALRELEEDGEI